MAGDISTLRIEQSRAMEDILEAERGMRAVSEKTVRDLRQLLVELAVRFDGTRLEQMRRSAPSIPDTWTVRDWRVFFSQVEVVGARSWTDPRAESCKRREQELLQQVEALKAQLNTLQANEAKPAPQQPAAKSKRTGKKTKKTPGAEINIIIPANVGQPQTDVPDGMIPSLATLIESVRQAANAFPEKPPTTYRKMLDGNGRRGMDLKRAYRRYWTALYLLGRWGIGAQLEIADVQSILDGVTPSSSSLRRPLADLVNANLLQEQILRLGRAPSSSLKLYTLSTEGARLYQLLFEREPVESELATLNRLHEGERFPDHALAVLIFALHARKRGWATQVMPVVEGKAAPDIRVFRDGTQYCVEVERSVKEKSAKWRNLAALNGGTVALCAMVPKGRKRLVGDCKLAKVRSGLAADLKTLVMIKYAEIGADTPLWVETW